MQNSSKTKVPENSIVAVEAEVVVFVTVFFVVVVAALVVAVVTVVHSEFARDNGTFVFEPNNTNNEEEERRFFATCIVRSTENGLF